jgi:hypothetical protein
MWVRSGITESKDRHCKNTLQNTLIDYMCVSSSSYPHQQMEILTLYHGQSYRWKSKISMFLFEILLEFFSGVWYWGLNSGPGKSALSLSHTSSPEFFNEITCYLFLAMDTALSHCSSFAFWLLRLICTQKEWALWHMLQILAPKHCLSFHVMYGIFARQTFWLPHEILLSLILYIFSMFIRCSRQKKKKKTKSWSLLHNIFKDYSYFSRNLYNFSKSKSLSQL